MAILGSKKNWNITIAVYEYKHYKFTITLKTINIIEGDIYLYISDNLFSNIKPANKN
jgi:hypothetical protein